MKKLKFVIDIGVIIKNECKFINRLNLATRISILLLPNIYCKLLKLFLSIKKNTEQIFIKL